MSPTHRVLIASLGVAIGCPGSGVQPREIEPAGPNPRGAVEFRTCESEDPPPAKSVSSFRHLGSRAIALTTAWHSGDDVSGCSDGAAGNPAR